ncbi:hypothetical protein [Pseudomonas amygdali]|uniref:Holin n=2 Tax=Pseudomonas amygdali pv. lachrymans TaxID=53707 RepID=A0ABR5KUA4_PSEAV|nr:hypothetical protein [Pseudomonas amygdali]AXH59751.1 hypothetical protein PLA107_031505 [Pseudomonas amygdali pv. lachrymans str. M301315]KPC17173.1 Uncharacterized protein AC499_0375 [Pseudomonas amygdali pv. lachrymans]KPC18132.1 Uncharacterized protein AC499_1334 [Pseudomonas amygdali pv. lachrymans]RMT06526.1 hypothetical protein ALP54_03652 [Pseudomonas amygdali pv. lachrymans]
MGFITLVAFLMVAKCSIFGPWKKLSRWLSGVYLMGAAMKMTYSLTDAPAIVWNVGSYICWIVAIVNKFWNPNLDHLVMIRPLILKHAKAGDRS